MTVDVAGRDLDVVRLIARFKQASSRQVHELLFHDRTYKPADRALKRLTTHQLLHRIERRMVGGARGGSGQYVYALGRRGWVNFYGAAGYSVKHTVDYHALAIVDAYITFKRLERSGRLTIRGLSTEPDCWVSVAGDDLMPDLELELEDAYGRRLRLWLEIDMATENQKRITEKLSRYRRVHDSGALEEFPIVIWVAIDDERAKELKWLIERLPKESQALFRVRTLDNLGAAFRG